SVAQMRTEPLAKGAAAPQPGRAPRRHHKIGFFKKRQENPGGVPTIPLPFDNPHPSRYRPGKRAQALTTSLPAESPATPHRHSMKLAALVLVIAALGLPINDLFRYALLLVAAVVVVAGERSPRRAPWLGALAAVALCIVGQVLLPAPRIEEGHNVFLLDAPGGALEAGLPPAAFRFMAAEFDARYPRARRCDPAQDGCWRGQAF